MGHRLILDTSVLIAWERGITLAGLNQDEDDVAIAAITVAELRVGALRAQNSAIARRRAAVIETLMNHVSVLEYSSATAIAHAELMAHVLNVGKPRGHHDLIIAAHAVQTGRLVVSNDSRARFAELPGVHTLDH
ncbi:MAG: PIN domain-containing protein [Bifidobacteriaceae bacterium]|jgi:predicted nucleic acid-binding protein|nr:PIN domain-containing protein [Bifidobacteriaceae bacterium]